MSDAPKARNETVREAVAVFDDAATLQAAIDELLISGFDRAEISLLAGAKAVEDKLGKVYYKARDLEDSPDVPRTAYVSDDSIAEAEGAVAGALMYIGATVVTGAVVASGGALATAVVTMAMAAGAGGLIGSMLSKLIEDHHAAYIEDQLTHGGLLLWVRIFDKERERDACAILSRHGGRDVHVHDLPVPAGA